MSVTSIHQCKNLKAIIHYCTTPKTRQQSERVAAIYSDFGNNSEFFLKYGEQTIKNHHRKVQGFTILQSFPKHEFDVHNQEHIIYVNELGRKLVYALYPNSPCLVITHADSNGQCLHNHIIVLNHDLKTDRCISANRHYKYVKKENDKLMEKYNLEVCTPSKQKQTQGEYWTNKRNGWFEQLQESVDKALVQSTSIQEFANYLIAEGVTASLHKKNGALKEHFTFSVTDANGKEHKKRSDKLGEAYSRKTIEQTILANKNSQQKQSIISMSEWIEIQKTLKKKQEKIVEESLPVPEVHFSEVIEPIISKPKKSPTIPEKETSMEEQKHQALLKLKEKEHQELLKKIHNIKTQIKMLEDGLEDDCTDEDLNKLNGLHKELQGLEVRKNQYKVKPTDIKLNEKLLPTFDNVRDKDQDFSK